MTLAPNETLSYEIDLTVPFSETTGTEQEIIVKALLNDGELEAWAKNDFSFSYYVANSYALIDEKEKEAVFKAQKESFLTSSITYLGREAFPRQYALKKFKEILDRRSKRLPNGV